MEFINYHEVLYLMDKLDGNGKAIPFSFECSTSKGTFLIMKRAIKSILDKSDEEIAVINKSAGRNKQSAVRNHKKMFVNVTNLDSGDIRKIYPRTILKFNGYKVNPEL